MAESEPQIEEGAAEQPFCVKIVGAQDTEFWLKLQKIMIAAKAQGRPLKVLLDGPEVEESMKAALKSLKPPVAEPAQPAKRPFWKRLFS